jgi:S1-C subfamily serine protease
MKISIISNWVRSKIAWLVVAGLIAVGVEVETGIGTQILQEVKELWDMPELSSDPVAIRDVLQSSVNLRCSHVTAPQGSGSGNIIHRFGHTYVLTAWHVIDCSLEGRTNIDEKVYFDVYQGTNVWKGRIISWSEKHDLALLRLDDVGLVGKSIRFLNPKTFPPVGMKLITAGNIFGSMPRSYSEGVLASLYVTSRLTPLVYMDQTTVTVYKGSSGSGVFTADGRYVGMVTQMSAPNVNYIVPVRRMWEWADENDLLWLFLCK